MLEDSDLIRLICGIDSAGLEYVLDFELTEGDILRIFVENDLFLDIL